MGDKHLLRLDPEEALVWHLIDRRFSELHGSWLTNVDWKRFNWEKAMAYAHRNSVLYKFCQEALRKGSGHVDAGNLRVLDSVVKKGDQELKRLLKTLITIKDLWDEQIDYYIIKTRDDRPTYDADVLFMDKKDYESAICLAQRSGYRFIREEPSKGWIDVENAVKIELHHGISWFGMRVMDSDFVASDPRKVKLMNLVFQTISEKAECALHLAHWVMDIQPLTMSGFSNLVSNVEKDSRWKEIIHQAEKYGWAKQLVYHLSVLKKLCIYAYSYRLRLPIKPLNVKVNPCFPFWVPFQIKIPFLTRKVMNDNNGFAQRLKMLQLSLRRYLWTRVWR